MAPLWKVTTNREAVLHRNAFPLLLTLKDESNESMFYSPVKNTLCSYVSKVFYCADDTTMQSYNHTAINSTFREVIMFLSVSERCWSNFMVILEAVIWAAVELRCVAPRGAPNVFSIAFISTGTTTNYFLQVTITLNQHLYKTVLRIVEFNDLHEGWIYCKTVAWDCISFSFMYL